MRERTNVNECRVMPVNVQRLLLVPFDLLFEKTLGKSFYY